MVLFIVKAFLRGKYTGVEDVFGSVYFASKKNELHKSGKVRRIWNMCSRFLGGGPFCHPPPHPWAAVFLGNFRKTLTSPRRVTSESYKISWWNGNHKIKQLISFVTLISRYESSPKTTAWFKKFLFLKKFL